MTLAGLERNWLLLWKNPPGTRFQNYYRRNHRNGGTLSVAVQALRFGVALVLLCIGLLLLFLPLVYIPFLFISAALFASESRTVARHLDHAEAWSHETWSRFRLRMGISRHGSNMIFATIGMGCMILAGFTCYRTFGH